MKPVKLATALATALLLTMPMAAFAESSSTVMAGRKVIQREFSK